MRFTEITYLPRPSEAAPQQSLYATRIGFGRGRIVDYLGTHQHLAVDIDPAVTARGALRLRSGE